MKKKTTLIIKAESKWVSKGRKRILCCIVHHHQHTLSPILVFSLLNCLPNAKRNQRAMLQNRKYNCPQASQRNIISSMCVCKQDEQALKQILTYKNDHSHLPFPVSGWVVWFNGLCTWCTLAPWGHFNVQHFELQRLGGFQAVSRHNIDACCFVFYI